MLTLVEAIVVGAIEGVAQALELVDGAQSSAAVRARRVALEIRGSAAGRPASFHVALSDYASPIRVAKGTMRDALGLHGGVADRLLALGALTGMAAVLDEIARQPMPPALHIQLQAHSARLRSAAAVYDQSSPPGSTTTEPPLAVVCRHLAELAAIGLCASIENCGVARFTLRAAARSFPRSRSNRPSASETY